MNKIFFKEEFDTILGRMLAVADDDALLSLAFIEQNTASCYISNYIIENLKSDLADYFAGKLKKFTTPVCFEGTSFQQNSWEYLQTISYGETKSYSDQAIAIGIPTAFRAVANANAKNKIAILVPCHRVINSNGRLAGYAGGIHRKKWLLEHEMGNTI